LDLADSTEAEIFVLQIEADLAAGKRFIFGIWKKADSCYTGDIWIERQDWDVPLHEIGYFLVSDQVGKGLATEATEATRAALAFVFKHLRSKKAGLTCDEDNEPAYRLAVLNASKIPF
jgi:RimJ/RimL family protein N-acetyltransferase